MKFFSALACLAILLSFPAHATGPTQVCRFNNAPQKIPIAGGEFILIWNEENSDYLEEFVDADSTSLLSFRSWVRAQVNPNQNELLRRQRDRYVLAFGAAEGINYDLLISGMVGKILPLRCLDGLLLEALNSIHSLHTKQAEFFAWILESAVAMGQKKTRILFQSSNHLYVSISDTLTTQMKQALSEGWLLKSNLHNHPFFFNNPVGDIAGTIMPSESDRATYINYAQKFGLLEACITNGFDTFQASIQEMEAFSAFHPPEQPFSKS